MSDIVQVVCLLTITVSVAGIAFVVRAICRDLTNISRRLRDLEGAGGRGGRVKR